MKDVYKLSGSTSNHITRQVAEPELVRTVLQVSQVLQVHKIVPECPDNR